MVFEIKGVGGTYGGTTIGITNTLGMLGAFVAPPIGNSLTAINGDIPLFFWGLLGLVASYCLEDLGFLSPYQLRP